jgi:hypothetical protein
VVLIDRFEGDVGELIEAYEQGVRGVLTSVENSVHPCAGTCPSDRCLTRDTHFMYE